jgi:hypothetical protein
MSDMPQPRHGLFGSVAHVYPTTRDEAVRASALLPVRCTSHRRDEPLELLPENCSETPSVALIGLMRGDRSSSGEAAHEWATRAGYRASR